MKSVFNKYLNSTVGALGFLGLLTAQGEVIEIQSIDELLTYVTQSTLVVFDLDNTVMEPPQTLGSDQWFGHVVRVYLSQGMEESEAIDAALADWISVQEKSRMRPVEAKTSEVIADLQALYQVIALTARPFVLAERTENQLSAIGVDFGYADTWLDSKYLSGKMPYHRGVISLGAKESKGATLSRFLELSAVEFDRIVFIDDKKKHVDDVDSTLTRLGWQVYALRYGALDAKVSAFDSSLADTQSQFFRDFDLLLGDEVVQVILNQACLR